ncbi:MAG TPA: transporter substrate-binding domain-containing protein [Candidatus Mediterraneibacter gallistercoris]|uniref:Transporter substrate-binding domain-containing protein n=1 Tax=Candidatus Mediterraneibacter gallistercoris TaxID=2838671 RepID=A0A9D2P3H6_9FIRM|nr:transporter substrate-binding domain-containing protein [Candidatus Mediterraneibacter gallistercoris]
MTTAMVMTLAAGCGSSSGSSTGSEDKTSAEDSGSSSSSGTDGSVKGALDGVKLSFGTTALFAPFTYYDKDGTTLIGFDIDLEKALQDYLGFELDGDVQVMDYSALTTSLAEGKLDFGMAALCATDERKAVMQFSDTYCDSGQVVMINKETSPKEITDIDTLIDGDYTIAVEKGTASHLYCQNNGVDDSRLEVHDTITTAYESLEQGKVDAVIQDSPNAYYYIKTTDNTKLEVVGDQFNQGQSPYAIAISNDAAERNDGLVDIFNQALSDLTDNGTIDELTSTWLE